MTGRQNVRSRYIIWAALLAMLLLPMQFAGAQQYNWIYQAGNPNVNPPFSYPAGIGQAGYPRARMQAAHCTDMTGHLWMFGGRGKDEGVQVAAHLSDLWKFDVLTKQWLWMGGSTSSGATPAYPAQLGQPGTPGARRGAAMWSDHNGNLWLFGGYGYGSDGQGDLSDLWKFNQLTKVWTHEAGPTTRLSPGVYAGVNQPGMPAARSDAATGITSTGDLLLFGGGSTGTYYNDLWKFSPSTPTTWHLLGGGNLPEQFGNYPSAVGGTGYPGGRALMASFTDVDSNMWIYGGQGHSASTTGRLGDLWLYQTDTNQFTYIGGSSAASASTLYPAGYNQAGQLGGRNLPLHWTDGEKFWLGGGFGSSAGTTGRFNDLWSFSQVDPNIRYIDGPKGETEGIYPTTSLTSGLPHGRVGGVCWTINGTLYLFGGSPDAVSVFNDMWTHPGYPNSSVGEWSLY